MRKKRILFVLFVIAGLVLSACEQGGDATEGGFVPVVVDDFDVHDPIKVGASSDEPGHERRLPRILSRHIYHRNRITATVTVELAPRQPGCPVAGQDRLAEAAHASEQGQLPEWDTTLPQPRNGPRRDFRRRRDNDAHVSSSSM